MLKIALILAAGAFFVGIGLAALWWTDREIRFPMSIGQPSLEVQVEIEGLDVPSLGLRASYLCARRIELVSYHSGIIGGGLEAPYSEAFKLVKRGDKYEGRIPARLWFLAGWNLSQFEITASAEKLAPLLGAVSPTASQAERASRREFAASVVRVSTRSPTNDVTYPEDCVCARPAADGTTHVATQLPDSERGRQCIALEGLRKLVLEVHSPVVGRAFTIPRLIGFFGELDRMKGWKDGEHAESGAFVSGNRPSAHGAPEEPVLHLRPGTRVPLPLLLQDVGPVNTKRAEVCSAAVDADSLRALGRESNLDFPGIVGVAPTRTVGLQWPRRIGADRVHSLCNEYGAPMPITIVSQTSNDVIIEAKPGAAAGPWFLVVGWRNEDEAEGGIDALPVIVENP